MFTRAAVSARVHGPTLIHEVLRARWRESELPAWFVGSLPTLTGTTICPNASALRRADCPEHLGTARLKRQSYALCVNCYANRVRRQKSLTPAPMVSATVYR